MSGEIKYAGEIEAAIREAADMSKVKGIEARSFDADGLHEILIVQTKGKSVMVRVNAALTETLPSSQRHQRTAVAVPVSERDIADLLNGSLYWERVQEAESRREKAIPRGVYSVEEIAGRIVKYLGIANQ